MTQPADRDAVQFTRESATRIANVVRTVEIGAPKLKPLVFDRPVERGGGKKVFRVCTFTGAWAEGTLKVVTFKYQTTTPNTASVRNLVVGLSPTAASDVSIAKDGTAWFLLQPNLTQQPNFAAGTTQVLGHINGVLRWIDTSNCP